MVTQEAVNKKKKEKRKKVILLIPAEKSRIVVIHIEFISAL